MKNALLVSVVLFAFLCSIFGCTTKKCIEKESDDCVCTMQYDPVCGCNDKTYSNACEAECHGITTYTTGPCKDDVK